MFSGVVEQKPRVKEDHGYGEEGNPLGRMRWNAQRCRARTQRDICAIALWRRTDAPREPGVQAQAPGSVCGEEEPEERKEHRKLTPVRPPEELSAARGVHPEIGHRHLPGCKERQRASEQPERDGGAAGHFDDAGSTEAGKQIRGPAVRPEATEPAQHFLGAV